MKRQAQNILNYYTLRREHFNCLKEYINISYFLCFYFNLFQTMYVIDIACQMFGHVSSYKLSIENYQISQPNEETNLKHYVSHQIIICFDYTLILKHPPFLQNKNSSTRALNPIRTGKFSHSSTS